MSKQTGTSPTPSRPTPSATPVTGQLPPDFLRLQPAVTTVAAPVQYAVAPAYTTVVQQPVVVEPQPYAVLDILVKSAALLKSHSRFSKMDVYCVFSVGTEHRRTETHYNGDIAPVWGQIVSLPLYNTVQSDTLRVDVFDECMTGDDRFAWANIDNLQELLATGSIEGAFDLVGTGGPEGTIHLVLSMRAPPPLTTVQVVQDVYGNTRVVRNQYVQPVVQTVPFAAQPMPIPAIPQAVPVVATRPAQQPQPQQYVPTAADIANLKAMFPNLSDDIFESVLVSTGGNFDAAVTQLLELNQ
eukprot:Colp12_sorted_trinity150504_noHs@15500